MRGVYSWRGVYVGAGGRYLDDRVGEVHLLEDDGVFLNAQGLSRRRVLHVRRIKLNMGSSSSY